MKKITYYIAGLIAFATILSACDETLDLDPISEITSEYKKLENEGQVRSAVIGCYNGMQKPMETEWMLTELRSDNSVQGAPTSTNTQNIEFNQLDLFSLLPTHARVYEYWLATYHNISRVNTVFASISVMTDEDEKNKLEAECRFIRAYHYFNLVRLFGPVFIETENILPAQARLINRSPVDSVYALIERDLNFAIKTTSLPDKRSNADLGRVSKLAAKTLLAKVYLTQGNLTGARTLLEEVYGKHSLLPYDKVFSIQYEMNDEIIFAIRYKSGGYGIGSSFANRFAPSSSGSAVINGDGSGWNFPSYDLMNNGYEANDARKAVTVAIYGSGTWPKNYTKKYLSQVQTTYDAENDWPILRYSDVLLMLAEIINEKDGYTNALPLINKVRSEHGNLPALTGITSQDACRLAIEKERRVEFAFENQRFFDLVRTKRAVDVLNNHIFVADLKFYNRYTVATRPNAADIVKEWQLLLPIPQREIDANSKIVIAQNYGY